jgi:single-stranded-DNA-specific exonuclease
LELPWILVGPELVQALEKLEPHGMGNPAPLFALRGVRFNSAKIFGKEQDHVKLKFKNGLEGVWWGGARRFSKIAGETKNRPGPGSEHALDMVSNVGWNGFYKKLMLEIRDIGRLF